MRDKRRGNQNLLGEVDTDKEGPRRAGPDHMEWARASRVKGRKGHRVGRKGLGKSSRNAEGRQQEDMLNARS